MVIFLASQSSGSVQVNITRSEINRQAEEKGCGVELHPKIPNNIAPGD